VSNPDELNGTDEGEASEHSIVSEESLIAQSTQNGTLALLIICRTLNEIWQERCSKAFGGSFRYKIQQNEHGGKYAVGINVAGKLKPTVRGELLVWLRPAKVATVLELPERQVRDDIQRRFPTRVEKSTKTVVLGLKTEADADRLNGSTFVDLHRRFPIMNDRTERLLRTIGQRHDPKGALALCDLIGLHGITNSFELDVYSFTEDFSHVKKPRAPRLRSRQVTDLGLKSELESLSHIAANKVKIRKLHNELTNRFLKHLNGNFRCPAKSTTLLETPKCCLMKWI
jgi:hypothetical protein